MTILKRVLEDRHEWWHLVPDQTLFAGGGNTEGKVLNLAARHKDGRWAMVYLGSEASFAIDMSKIAAGEAEARWIDPRSGEAMPAGRFSTPAVQAFSTPDGWQDALLVLEALVC